MFHFLTFLVNEREELAHRLTESAFSAKRNAKEKTLSGAKKSAFGSTPHRLGKSMGKTPEMRSPALNVKNNLQQVNLN